MGRKVNKYFDRFVFTVFAAVPEGVLDEQMDLLRALEMSRIQFLKEQGVVYEDSDNRLVLLVHLSRRLIGELIGYSWSGVRPSLFRR